MALPRLFAVIASVAGRIVPRLSRSLVQQHKYFKTLALNYSNGSNHSLPASPCNNSTALPPQLKASSFLSLLKASKPPGIEPSLTAQYAEKAALRPDFVLKSGNGLRHCNAAATAPFKLM
ncbi:hypothetical protein ACJJTC_018805 [Scirpophaga incertulas]